MSHAAPTAVRIDALDAVRGFALFGILMVNMAYFSMPVGPEIMQHHEPGLDGAAQFATKWLFESKFFPLFSTLFGMGMAMQWMSARAAGRAFAPMYLRRLAFLALLGLSHGLLIWYGDILFLYSTIGLATMWLVRLSPRTLVIIAACVMTASAILGAGLNALMAPRADAPDHVAAAPHDAGADEPSDSNPDAGGSVGPDAPPAASADAPVVPGPGALSNAEVDPKPEEPSTPLDRAIEAMTRSGGSNQPPMADPRWIEAETEAFRDGPFSQATGFRAINFTMILIFSAFSFWWWAGSMFLIGAALVKSGYFTSWPKERVVRLTRLGLLVGIPSGLASAWLIWEPSPLRMGLGSIFMVAGIGSLPLGYLGVVRLAYERWPSALDPLARLGRIGLTGYLLESVITTGIMYHWGLGRFGSFGAAERAGLAVAIYAAVLVFANVWTRFFAIGPAEWAWRTFTYLSPPRLRRSTGGRGPGTVSG